MPAITAELNDLEIKIATDCHAKQGITFRMDIVLQSVLKIQLQLMENE